MRRTHSSIALALIFLASAALADTYPKNPALDVVNYRFELELFEGEERIEAEATIDLNVVEEGVRSLEFDLIDPASTDAGQEVTSHSRGMTVSQVRIDDEPVSFRHAEARLKIPLAAPLAAARSVKVQITYAGSPADALGIGPNKHGTWSWFSDNWPNKARHWLPTVDHPYDKATSEMVVTAPARYQVISNGLLVEETDLPGGRRRSHWRQSVPVATWLYTLGVTEFAVQHLAPFKGKPVQTWVFAQDRNAGFYDFAEPTHHALEFYSDFVGSFSYEKLANVQSARTKGGMEAASAIMYDDRSVTGERSKRWRNVVIHEIAHQWFGNAVTEADWDDVWLSEGFATYFTLLFIEHAYGRDEFVQGLEQSRERVLEFYRRNPVDSIVHDNLSDMSKVTSGNTYQKGAWALHMLRSMIGDEAFWEGIRHYYRQYQDSSASTADFRHVMEKASGQELKWFFDQWLRRGGALLMDWTYSYDTTTRTLTVDLKQTQREAPFRARIPLRVVYQPESDDQPLTLTETLWVDQRSEALSFVVPGAPLRVELDPNVEVLMEAQLRQP